MKELNKACTTRRELVSIQILDQCFSLVIWIALMTALSIDVEKAPSQLYLSQP